MTDRLERQIAFLAEIDRLKSVIRRSYLIDGSRRENSAEHSWHLATAVIVLGEQADPNVDLLRAVKMALVHDIVEIDAGDTFLYDEAAAAQKEELEQKAAERLFSLLPEDEAEALKSLWKEFEAGETPTARFVRGLDRLLPLLHNYYTQGRTWREHNIRLPQVLKMNARIEEASPELWRFAQALIQDAAAKGYLAI